MSGQLLLIDALNLIRRIYAVDSNQNKGCDEQMIITCCARVAHACEKLLKITQATHAIAVFDGDKSWRYHYYKQYKSSRAPMPETLRNSLAKFKHAIEQTGIIVFAPVNDEADDIIATLAHKMAKNQLHSTIVSTDKGFLPSLNNYISVYDYFKKEYLDLNSIHQRFGVEQARLIDFWAMAGDKTNDIPGIKGVGTKTAQDVIAKHADITLAANDESLSPGTRKKLASGMEDYIISKNLVSLRTDINLGFSLKQLRLN
ncbi:protein Xni [Pseudoalteromonas porphyrae]|uniref:flap endonuclease Xni n=1 Tax=Pseudoalteromonas porphyrae TaxID=187330 RepID=UPI0006BAC5EF|nr:flap endonuclease Xni [Pseudoalteromonas porphyrae]KPH95879.1 protein Xni [Pseudoalteromonas porphyrae]